ncbi:MAG: leucyl aminopeptidase family protein [Planctomycetota bacterium]|nr:leucyl aminopeptidase family protein [Planctomycetota bacterium]MDW8373467.1 leucyl aminopeptidase family protein [Planctomycetota bacterium]
MQRITVSAARGAAELTAIVIGHAAGPFPPVIEEAAARIAAKQATAPLLVVTEQGPFVLVKPEAKPWLTGGEAWRLLGGQIVDAARQLRVGSVTVVAEGEGVEAQALVEGCVLADYRYEAWKKKEDPESRPRLTVRLPGYASAVREGVAIATAQNLARELADSPPNELHPQSFAARARRELAGLGARLRVISGAAQLRRAGFPGLAQVGQAGSSEPCLVEVRYTPPRDRQAQRDLHLALVGKGITFDSGGLSLKPGDKMWEMKADMSGAAAVLAALTRILAERPPYPLSAFLCLAENLPDSRAQRPGDIYRARNGTSVHVENTDAEGRLIMADALTYACESGATHLVDLATLTGACIVALGEYVAGAMGRHEDWTRQVCAAGAAVGEQIWPLPLHGEYRKLLEHPHADINNVGGKWGGAITAGLFLAEFVPENVHWVHLDIAGPAMANDGWRYYSKGFTGFGTRTLIRLARELAG